MLLAVEINFNGIIIAGYFSNLNVIWPVKMAENCCALYRRLPITLNDLRRKGRPLIILLLGFVIVLPGQTKVNNSSTLTNNQLKSEFE